MLANYEFFSSMIRNFRVSVSDKYPVKMEKWKDLGTYEARNSREIQAFLIENPQIWARYLRIEFLSHYGNEYYCPLSLVRVHGTRMLESWKETEAIGEDDDNEDPDQKSAEEYFVPDAVADIVQEEERLQAELKEAQAVIQELIKTAKGTPSNQFSSDSSQFADGDGVGDGVGSVTNTYPSHLTTTWNRPSLADLFESSIIIGTTDICPAAAAPVYPPKPSVSAERGAESSSIVGTVPAATLNAASTTTSPICSSAHSASQFMEADPPNNFTQSDSATLPGPSVTRTTVESQESGLSIAAGVTNKQNTTTPRNKTTSTSSATSALPTIQESFFKAVSRRLQLLETNSTLSLKYIEEQSRILREAFSKVERKQLQKTTTFLDTLNGTVLAELRVFRQQYDEIWQSTVISLESQREASQREFLAISARLNILADEVVFQKRMSIVQSLLLLLCLGLVIFSRVSASGHLDLQSIQTRARAFGFPISPLESPPGSPEYHGNDSRRATEQWSSHELRSRSPISRSSRSRDNSPPTPDSTYSDAAYTPPSGGDDISRSTHLQLPLERRGTSSAPTSWQDEGSDAAELSSPATTPRIRKVFVRQQGTPMSDHDDIVQKTLVQEDVMFRYADADRPSPPPSPRHNGRSEDSIARKPLPALPPDQT